MKRIVIVTGPPFGGKSTYVRAHMGPNDVVYDFDEMKAAVCLCNPHAEKITRGNYCGTCDTPSWNT